MGDWSSYDYMRGSRRDGFGGGRYPSLVPAILSFRTYSRSHDGEAAAQFLP